MSKTATPPKPRVIDLKLNEPQARFLACTKQMALARGGSGSGKAQPNDTPTLTPYGWVPIGDLRPGDFVIGKNGRPTRVLATWPQGVKPVVRFTFHDGTTTRCCHDHLWTTRRGDRLWSVRTTTNLMALYSRERKSKFVVPVVEPVEFSDEFVAPKPIEPYALGLLLGNGCFIEGITPTFSSGDDELIDHLKASLDDCAPRKINGPDWALRAMSGRARGTDGRFGRGNPLITALESLDLRGKHSDRKFVPTQYLLASADDRLAVLQGLMDTDGTVCKRPGKEIGGATFCTTSAQLAEDVCFLVRSLGGEARLGGPYIKHYTHNGEKRTGKPAYIINVKMTTCPFRLQRKASAWRAPVKYFPNKIIRSIEQAGEAECTCITVDAEDGLYVTEGFIVTHNTHIGKLFAVKMMHQYPKALGLITANTYDQLNKNTVKPLLSFLRDYGLPYVYNKAPPWYQSRFEGAAAHNGILSFPNGAQVQCTSLENYEMKRGAEYGWWWGDETRDTKREAFDVIIGRLRDKNGPLYIRFTTTPKGVEDWTYDIFYEECEKNNALYASREIFPMPTWLNRHNLPPKYIETMQEHLDPDMYQQEVMGEWVNISVGRAYPCFDRDVNVDANLKYVKTLPLCLSCDFNQTPMGWVVVQQQDGIDCVLGEIWRESTRASMSASESAARDFVDKWGDHAGEVHVYGDASGHARHSSTTATDYAVVMSILVRHFGRRVKLFSRTNAAGETAASNTTPVADRVALVNARLRNSLGNVQMKIHPTCRTLIRDLQQVTWSRSTTTTRALDKRNPLLTHVSDALGYYTLGVHGSQRMPLWTTNRVALVGADGKPWNDGIRPT